MLEILKKLLELLVNSPKSEPKYREDGNKMRLENEFYIWKKDDKLEYLSKYFSTKEFECKCSNVECVEQRVSKKLIDKLNSLRDAVKSSVRVHSGFRCSAYQNKLIGDAEKAKQENERRVKLGLPQIPVKLTVVAKKSTHELGEAADVSTSSLSSLELIKVAELFFDSIGTANSFLHLDTRIGKRRWRY